MPPIDHLPRARRDDAELCLDPAAPADEWIERLAAVCERHASPSAPSVVAVRVRVPSGQSGRMLEQAVTRLRRDGIPLAQLEERPMAEWDRVDVSALAMRSGLPYIPFRVGRCVHALIVEVEHCFDGRPEAASRIDASAWPGRPADPALGMLIVRREGILSPAIRGLTRVVPGEETIYLGEDPLRISVGHGGELRIAELSGEMFWSPAVGWRWRGCTIPGVRVVADGGSLMVASGHPLRTILRAHTLARPLSLRRAAAIAGRVPCVSVTMQGRVLPMPRSRGGWGIPVHELRGIPLRGWVESSLPIGASWWSTDGERVELLRRDGSLEAAFGEEEMGIPCLHSVHRRTNIARDFAGALIATARPVFAHATRSQPIRIDATPDSAGDPYLSRADLTIRPSRQPASAELVLARRATVPSLWHRTVTSRIACWTRLEPESQSVPIPCDLIAATTWLRLSPAFDPDPDPDT